MKIFSFKRTELWICALLLFILIPYETYGLRPFNYSQYMHNLGPINPNWYLLDFSASAQGAVRKQWMGMEGAPSTFIMNGHIPLDDLQAATGLNLFFDNVGPHRVMELNSFFAKTVRVSSLSYLSASLSVGLSRYEGLYSSIDDHDPLFQDDVLETAATLGLGMMFYSPERFYAGFSIPKLSTEELGLASRKSDYNFNGTYYLTGGYLASLGEVFKIKPVGMVSKTKGLPTTLDISSTLYFQEALGLGLSYSTLRELGIHASIHASNHLQLSYNYQFGMESYVVSNFGSNSHEVAVTYRFGDKVMKKL